MQLNYPKIQNLRSNKIIDNIIRFFNVVGACAPGMVVYYLVASFTFWNFEWFLEIPTWVAPARLAAGSVLVMICIASYMISNGIIADISEEEL